VRFQPDSAFDNSRIQPMAKTHCFQRHFLAKRFFFLLLFFFLSQDVDFLKEGVEANPVAPRSGVFAYIM
jgi:hypothetical protein